jgi:hypothetical protein
LDFVRAAFASCHQIALRFHYGVDGLVRHRRFVDNVRVLTTLRTGVLRREAVVSLDASRTPAMLMKCGDISGTH